MAGWPAGCCLAGCLASWLAGWLAGLVNWYKMIKLGGGSVQMGADLLGRHTDRFDHWVVAIDPKSGIWAGVRIR